MRLGRHLCIFQIRDDRMNGRDPFRDMVFFFSIYCPRRKETFEGLVASCHTGIRAPACGSSVSEAVYPDDSRQALGRDLQSRAGGPWTPPGFGLHPMYHPTRVSFLFGEARRHRDVPALSSTRRQRPATHGSPRMSFPPPRFLPAEWMLVLWGEFGGRFTKSCGKATESPVMQPFV